MDLIDMGYRVTRKSYRLVFPEDDPLSGLEITVGGLTLGQFNDMRNKVDGEPNVFAKKELETNYFLDKVTGWNLEDEDGQAAKVGREGFESLGPADTTTILRTWLSVALGGVVGAPLDGRSNDGDSSGSTPNTLGSIPMETL